ncbi:lia operon protein LiaF [Evansella caseinilytica]|uniref:Lia operon protein LiaF n=1 Tax=Evansella caseinilytica TaxID=1503961 RepID=A0A1H3PUB6_9BACI|nr:cell wall-active antibiotics response protein LiaF [Evansella caseinilytica]SDZ04570.1 lia operon protein LiaF [Evansella caseinilytica]
MFKRFSTDTFNWILIIGIALLLAELIFFKAHLVFFFLFLSFICYFGWKSYHRSSGKLFFWSGMIFLFLTVSNMVAIRFMVVAILVMLFIQYRRSKKEPEQIKPYFYGGDAEDIPPSEPLLKVEPLFQNRFFGDLKTSDTAYHWRDINIHSGLGDRVIDLSNTVLPEHSVISIRHFVGNIKIYIPYEVDVIIHHSSVFGRAAVFDKQHTKLFNQTLSYATVEKGSNNPQVKIITSILSGDIEVKRI